MPVRRSHVSALDVIAYSGTEVTLTPRRNGHVCAVDRNRARRPLPDVAANRDRFPSRWRMRRPTSPRSRCSSGGGARACSSRTHARARRRTRSCGQGSRERRPFSPAALAKRERAVRDRDVRRSPPGHRRVLEAVLSAGPTPTVVTFDPHPRSVVGSPPPLLAPVERRCWSCSKRPGSRTCSSSRSTTRWRRSSRRPFVEAVLAASVGTAVVAAGEDFRFGCGRSGRPRHAARLGFDRRGPSGCRRACRPSAIRELVRAQELAGRRRAARRALRGRGDRRRRRALGRKLGFPTANLDLPPEPDPAAVRDLRRRHARAPLGDLDRRQPALRPRGAEGRGPPPRLRRRPLRPAAGRRAVDAPSGRARLRSEAQLVEAIAADVAASRSPVRPPAG